MHILRILLLFIFANQLFAQNLNTEKFTISGSITDANNGEELIGASITVTQLPGVGAVTNAYGFYSLTLPKGEYEIVYHYIGFVDQIEKINLIANQTRNLNLLLLKKN